MRIIIVARERSDYNREIVDYTRDFFRITGRELEMIDPDSRDGISFCSVYGIMRYPTVIVVSDSGIMQQIWQGKPLPTINELSYYK